MAVLHLRFTGQVSEDLLSGRRTVLVLTDQYIEFEVGDRINVEHKGMLDITYRYRLAKLLDIMQLPWTRTVDGETVEIPAAEALEPMLGMTLDEFRETWDSVHAEDGRGWDDNPVVQIVRVKPQIMAPKIAVEWVADTWTRHESVTVTREGGEE